MYINVFIVKGEAVDVVNLVLIYLIDAAYPLLYVLGLGMFVRSLLRYNF